MSDRTWLISGASSGLGYAVGKYVLENGDRAVLAARSIPSMQELAAEYPDTALAVALDVTDDEQRTNVVTRAEEHFGAIDILLNNAGIDYLGAIEEQEEVHYRKIFEVNFFGAVALLRLVLPGMRRRRNGIIANMSSMDGLASLAANGFYSASKFALEGVTEALWQEIQPLGLQATLIEPGSFRTGIGSRTTFSGPRIDAYKATSGAFRTAMAGMDDAMFPGDPALAARAIYTALTTDKVPHRIILGQDAYTKIGTKLDDLRADYVAGKQLAFSTDYPS